MRKIKKNDDVIVIAGKDKGNRGSVQQVLGEYLLVGGINKVKTDPVLRENGLQHAQPEEL